MLICALWPVWAAAASPEEVHFPSLDGTTLKGWLFKPASPAPHATVVALHGCGGLYATTGARKGELNARHQAMADWLVGEGCAVLFPDSLTPRGERELCTQKIGQRRIDQTQRRADALGAGAWVLAQPWAAPQRLALLGWSHGGSAVLAATDATRREVAAQPWRFALGVAFYPGCSAALKSGYRPATRLAMMLGELDDWTPPGPCIELGQAVGAEVNVYPGSYHDFDNPIGSVRLRADVPNGTHPGQGVHAGRNPVAREQAYARLKELLREALR
ncbi:dienelactone hydrolase family protein [Variovorax terrae]|uniref:Dienelactone hydrolase family protein n=1 Tax=Variovorax terrae TaxID=2923278 RepID=A0A9X1VVF0_9BURK|nr:dienelactone hydrolase family protein [Variovorax terrae]MCJ0763899.1 dienelactone hydrolase family protein [Variovorax terrae]